MSVAFLEATVNEVFEDATDDRHVGQRVERLEPRVRAMLASFWESVGNGRYSLLGKYQMALLLSGAGQFDKGAQPYQDAQLLIDFRNGLVHFRPDWHDSGTKRKFDSLGDPFHQRGLLSDEDSSDWLTVKALGASGALGALATAKAFADEWTSRLGIPKHMIRTWSTWIRNSAAIDLAEYSSSAADSSRLGLSAAAPKDPSEQAHLGRGLSPMRTSFLRCCLKRCTRLLPSISCMRPNSWAFKVAIRVKLEVVTSRPLPAFDSCMAPISSRT